MTRYTHRSPDLLARGAYTDKQRGRLRNRANICIDGALFEQIREIAVEEEASISTVIRELVRDALAARTLNSSGGPA